MRAVLIGQTGKPELVEVPLPIAGRGEVVIKMIACGICGTDIEKIKGHYKGSMPVIGHEAVGSVEEVGDDVSGFRKGIIVVPHHHVECGKCYYCIHGSETMCPEYRKYNFIPGGFAEFFKLPAWIVSNGGIHVPPRNINPEEATLTEPLACCIRALKRVGLKRGINALILGLGPIGLLFIKLLRYYEAESVIGYDLTEYRLKMAEKAGAKVVHSDNVATELPYIVDRRGVDLTILATGSMKGLATALDCTRPGGIVCLFGLPPHNSKLDYDISRLVNYELSIVTSNAATKKEMDEALKLISEGVIKVDDIITHRLSLDRFGEALEIYESRDCGKIIITP
ncbi:MAG: alcohol dehydrogenase catalytic domain-containing protein [Nitrososphaerota archaeon]